MEWDRRDDDHRPATGLARVDAGVRRAICRGNRARREDDPDRPAGGHAPDRIATTALRQPLRRPGDLDRAIAVLEESLTLSRNRGSVGWSTGRVPRALAYAQRGRTEEALRLAHEGLATGEPLGDETRSCRFRQLGEIHLLAGHPAEAFAHAHQALGLARDRKQRAFEALTLRLLAAIAARPDRFEPETAEAHARQALALGTELHMRPLMAHCHLDLGMLHRRAGKLVEARQDIATAVAMFEAMGMTVGRKAEAALH
jgi:tetratricopeptide (TPR) repeat protein